MSRTPKAKEVVGDIPLDVVLQREDQAAYQRVQEQIRTRRQPNDKDRRAALRFEQARDQAMFARLVEKVPQKLVCEWGGVRNQQLNNFAFQYGVPVKGATVSIPEFVRHYFRFLAKHGRTIRNAAEDDGNDPVMGGPSSPGLEELRREKLLMARLQRQEMTKSLIPVEDVVMAMRLAGTALRAGAERLKRDCEPRALDIYNDALENCNAAIRTFYARLGVEEDTELLADGAPDVRGVSEGTATADDA